MADNIITAYLHGQDPVSVPAVYQYNNGMILKFSGVDLPAAYTVDFANNISGTSISQVGGPEGVTIPDQFFAPGATIHAWVVLAGDGYAVTRHHIIIPISPRAQRTDDEPTPSQQSALDEAVGALNAAVETVEEIAAEIPQTIQAALTEAKESGEFDGEPGQDGISPEISVTAITAGHQITITDATGTKTVDVPDGTDGEDGVGILSITKTGASGPVDTYTITYTNGQTTTFTVTNGRDGDDGYSPTASVSKSGDTATITITDKTGTTSAQVSDGAPGVSPSITVTDITCGHRVTVTDADGTHNFDVMDGEDYVLTQQDKADIAAMVDVPVQDVQVNSTSILSNGVANVPVASTSKIGVVSISSSYGVNINPYNSLMIEKATDEQVKNGSAFYRPIVPINQHAAAFYGLTKAAGADMASSSNPVGTYTDAAKVAIQKMLGVYQAPFSLIYENTITEETGKISIISDMGSNPFSLQEIIILFDGVVGTGSSAGGVIINSGSTGSNVAYLSITALYSTSAQTRTAHIQIVGGRMFGETESSNFTNAYGPVNLQRNKNSSGWIESGLINEITILSLNDLKFAGGTIRVYGR